MNKLPGSAPGSGALPEIDSVPLLIDKVVAVANDPPFTDRSSKIDVVPLVEADFEALTSPPEAVAPHALTAAFQLLKPVLVAGYVIEVAVSE